MSELPKEAVGVFVCGPSSGTCSCRCSTERKCDHVFDGKTVIIGEYDGATATCSRCGTWQINHDMWL